jgi:hypothetical protein
MSASKGSIGSDWGLDATSERPKTNTSPEGHRGPKSKRVGLIRHGQPSAHCTEKLVAFLVANSAQNAGFTYYSSGS